MFLINTKMQMGNLRADSENGSTVKSPNQDSVIGQIFLFSNVAYSVVIDSP